VNGKVQDRRKVAHTSVDEANQSKRNLTTQSINQLIKTKLHSSVRRERIRGANALQSNKRTSFATVLYSVQIWQSNLIVRGGIGVRLSTMQGWTASVA